MPSVQGTMRGPKATIPDVILCPVNNNVDLSCTESLSSEVGQSYTYKIAGPCVGCNQPLRLYVCTTRHGITKLEQQLTEDLGIFCGGCGRANFQHGGQKKR